MFVSQDTQRPIAVVDWLVFDNRCGQMSRKAILSLEASKLWRYFTH